MNNAIIGTAGHVDHGKTLLIKALTGIETDRLSEEKKRGITIELGFAYMTLPNGEKAGIVDVPGHEKFVRNMLAGAGSIDLAMLVIAADEGIMPQTREHLDILNTLGIKQGLVALNKTDLVDKDWLDMVILDIEEELKGSFLENAPIIPVSAYNGQGIDKLKEVIYEMLLNSPAKKVNTAFRLPIDRIFTMDGFGTVVTGTLIEGRLKTGSDVTVYPSMLTAKARRIHVHGEVVDTAYAGQRAAVNLAGLKLSDLGKGDWLCEPGSVENSKILDVVVEINKNCDRIIKHNSRLHFHHGASDVLCTLVLLDCDAVKAGERAYAQLRLAEPIAAKPSDRFVLRFYSPMETIGGGIILDPQAGRAKRGEEAAKRLEVKEKGGLAERIEIIFAERSNKLPNARRIKERYFYDESGFDSSFDKLLTTGKLKSALEFTVHTSFIKELGGRSQNILNKYHKENPLQKGMPIREFCMSLLPSVQPNNAESIVKLICGEGFIKINGQDVAHAQFTIKATDSHNKIRDAILSSFIDGGFSPPSYDDVASGFAKDKKIFEQVFQALVKSGDMLLLTPQIYVCKEYYDRAVQLFTDLAKSKGEVALADFRDAISASRKYALAFLEYFDKKGITKKVGDGRILL